MIDDTYLKGLSQGEMFVVRWGWWVGGWVDYDNFKFLILNSEFQFS
jgi:hypothetical protein